MTSVDLQVQQTGLVRAVPVYEASERCRGSCHRSFPDAEETAVVTAEEPAFFRLEAAAEGAVGNKLVDCCISVRSRQVVFFHKAVSSECFIKEGIRRDVVQILLGIASDTMIVNLVHRFELIRVALHCCGLMETVG